MSKAKINFLLAVAVIVFVALACGKSSRNNSRTPVKVHVNSSSSQTAEADSKQRPTTNDAETASTSGPEKIKPAAGKGNVQGKVLYNDQPVEGIEVKICENFSTVMGVKCDGETKTTKTDREGVYVLADLDPKTYGGLTAKVFQSSYYVYPQEAIMTPQRFVVEADKTSFARDINLFKDDIKITGPKAGSKVDAKAVALEWDAYPDAAYYKISLYPESGGLAPISGERVDETSYAVTEDLTNGKYRIKVEAYNSNDRKLAESRGDIKFTVTGGTDSAPQS